MTPVAILISGSGSNMFALVRSMTGDHPGRPVLVLSDNSTAAGLERAKTLGVPVAAVPRKDHDERASFEMALDAALQGAGAEVVCLAGFMRVLSAGFVARWRGRMLNIHPSLLPLHRGTNTHARVLAAGEAETGCTVHEVTPRLDAGPILGQARVPVLPGDTPESLAARLLGVEHVLYPAVLRRFVLGDRTPLLLP